jgi:hypothetical protein
MGHKVGKAQVEYKIRRGGTTYKGKVWVMVIDSREKQFLKKGNLVDIRLLAENSDKTPCYWDDDILNIYARHPIIAPHLGPEADRWPEQDSQVAKAIIENLIIRALAKRLNIRNKTNQFNYIERSDSDDIIFDEADGDMNMMITKLYKRMR